MDFDSISLQSSTKDAWRKCLYIRVSVASCSAETNWSIALKFYIYSTLTNTQSRLLSFPPTLKIKASSHKKIIKICYIFKNGSSGFDQI